MKHPFRAGVALTDISPLPGIELAGYPHHPRHNLGVHDPLYAGCLILDDGRTRLAIVTLDVLMCSKSYIRALRERVSARTGIPTRHLMVCCSHTHSGPWASGRLDLEGLEKELQPDAGYLETLNNKLVRLVEEAQSDLSEAKIGIGKGYCGREQGVGGNRHDPRGIADPEVWVLGVQDLERSWRGCLVKYALHPTFLHSDNLLVSADYPGCIRKHLATSKPGMVLLFAQGTSGNQSPRFFRSGKTFAEAERVGKALGQEVERVLDSTQLHDSLPLWTGSTEIEIEQRRLPASMEAEAQVATARKVWEELKALGASAEELWNAELKVLGAEDTLGYIRLEEKGRRFPLRDDELPVEIQVIGIGDARVVGIQGELFAEFGLTIQYRSPFVGTFVIELANGCLPGYAATARTYAEGGYEAGTSLLTGRSGDQIVEAAVQLLYQSRT
jgi:neutral ceramidase